jgi:hypothetical protein
MVLGRGLGPHPNTRAACVYEIEKYNTINPWWSKERRYCTSPVWQLKSGFGRQSGERVRCSPSCAMLLKVSVLIQAFYMVFDRIATGPGGFCRVADGRSSMLAGDLQDLRR